MKVHNIYSDILLSLSYFVNKVLEGQIKTFQYNIGSVSFNLDYNPNFEFPSAIINYVTSNYLNSRPDTFLRTFSNYNQIPILYNESKDIELKIQEDLFTVSIEIILNCDSQYSAINFKHLLESVLPLNKYLQLYKFVSYYELDDNYINPYLFDVSKDTIQNLIFKHNRITDELNYYFSVGYEPLIRLTSSSMNIGDISSSNFNLNLSFELLMHLPSKILFSYSNESQKKALFDSIKYLRHTNIKVPINSDNEHIEIQYKNNDNTLNIINCPCIFTDNSITGTFNNDELNLKLTATIDNYSMSASVSGIINTNSIVNAFVKIYSGSESTKYGTINGINISGKLKNVIIDNDNNLSAIFEGELNNFITTTTIENFKITNILMNRKISNLQYDTNFKILNSRLLETANIFSVIKTINSTKSELDFNLTKITGISFYNIAEDSYSNIFKLLEPISLNANGQFEFEFNSIIISGMISSNTVINISTVNNENNPNLQLFELEFDSVFKYFPIRGPGNIERITVDFNLTNEPISIISPIEILNYSPDKFNLVLDSLAITRLESTNRYSLVIPMPYFNKTIPTNYSFYFTHSGYMTDETKLELILDTVNSTVSELVFTTTNQFNFSYLNLVNKINPLFFSSSL